MSLAEELMADFDDDDDDDLEDIPDPAENLNGVKKEELEDDDIEEAIEEPMDTTKYATVHDVAKLARSEDYISLVKQLKIEIERPQEEVKVTAPLEADPQYKLIVKLSHVAADIDNEINVIHKFVRDKYEKRFPELETLVPNALNYLATVQLLGNDINSKLHKDQLNNILDASTCMVVSVTVSTTLGVKLEPDELQTIMDACDLAAELHVNRIEMHRLVEWRMSLIAPNLVALLGAATTAHLVSQAGGLTPLATMPSCNVQVLGKTKRNLVGFSTVSTNPHHGFIYFHPLVQQMPPDFKNKAAKILAAKVTLVARIDAQHESPNGEKGQDFLALVNGKFEKMLEPPPVKSNKALPKPLDKASKKRGGRRMRKMKERLGMTDLRKSANRMNFGELAEDVMQEHLGFDIGQVKTGNVTGGRIRTAAVDQKTRARMSQKMMRQMERQKAAGGMTSIRSKVAGTASSVTFTPVQGLEIINPAAQEQHQQSSSTSNYFSSSGSFVNIDRMTL
uniref:U4/U6 small nuclear ribonucleoprotein Prp31 n=1 Tax=Caenorhabditis japonica TaxID=281687 RepID=A0A8R1DS29_CAEJA